MFWLKFSMNYSNLFDVTSSSTYKRNKHTNHICTPAVFPLVWNDWSMDLSPPLICIACHCFAVGRFLMFLLLQFHSSFKSERNRISPCLTMGDRSLPKRCLNFGRTISICCMVPAMPYIIFLLSL